MKNKLYLGLLLMAASLNACQKDDNKPGPASGANILISQADSKGGNFSVSLMAGDTLFAGFNTIYLDVKEKAANVQVTSASISLHPLMSMVSMKHAAPVENPSGTADSDGYFKGAVVFVMPDNPAEHWSLGANITAGGVSDTVSLDIPVVKSPKESRIVNVISPVDGMTYFIALLEPAEPAVGINDIEFAAYYRKNMMNFPAAEDLTIGFVPEMPSMGHSSPNNIAPVYIGDGHYKGKVNFTMTGWWKINLTVEQGSQLVSDTLSFDITL